MSQLILKNIDITLDPASIQNAINEINELRDGLINGLATLAEQLTQHGEVVAKMYVARWSAIDTGNLVDSIVGEYDKGKHEGTISTGVEYAVYVEFGTGIVGAGASHPLSGELGIEYDRNNHGSGGWWYPSEKGWYQPENGPRLAWTKGMPSRPFMYDTMRELERVAETDGGRIIAEYIP